MEQKNATSLDLKQSKQYDFCGNKNMKHNIHPLSQPNFAVLPALALTMATSSAQAQIAAPTPTIPPQDQGLPYTRSARPRALARIKNHIAVFAGSRYGYMRGVRVRLASGSLLNGEAMLINGKVFVPASFAGALALKKVAVPPPPAELGPQIAERWVYSLNFPKVKVPNGLTTKIAGHNYIDLAALAQSLGLTVSQPVAGLLVIGETPLAFRPDENALRDSVVTLFDTPDKLADPDIATRFIPRLTKQGKWTDHVKATPEQLQLLNGPETIWPSVPKEKYNLKGFNARLLGSKAPPPGVYPRLLFSPEDLPMIRQRVQSQKLAQKSLVEQEVLLNHSFWNPQTSDGQVFQKLASPTEWRTLQWPTNSVSPGAGITRSLFEGQKQSLYSSHVNYNTQALVAMAQWCLLKGDDVRGKQVANAITNYFRLMEPEVDRALQKSDSEFSVADDGSAAETTWRGMHAILPAMDLPFALDFAGKWMDAEQKAFMINLIAKATYGRRSYGQDGPLRTRDINWMTWDLAHYLALAAIEGTPGCDPEGLEAGRQSMRAFLDWGIDSNGMIFESNGKSGGGIQFQILGMIALARRGDNLWGHPHWRKLLSAEAQVASPNGGVAFSSGTWASGLFTARAVNKILAFYPDDKAAAYLMTQQVPEFDVRTFDAAAYRAKLEPNPGRTRLPGISYPDMAFTVLYDTDWKPTTRAELKLPLTYNTDDYGLLSSRSDTSTEAAWMVLQARHNGYIGAGHHHADIGTFWFSSGGVNWLPTDTTVRNVYDGIYHNEVLIDGRAQPNGPPARGRYLGALTGTLADFATVDQTKSYSYRWTNQINFWDDSVPGPPWGDLKDRQWEVETDPLVLAVYRGTRHYKMRPWWHTYTFSNFVPVVRSPWNPVRYAFRTAGLVRGARPYGLVVDDVKKDDEVHLYQWSALPDAGITALPQSGSPDLLLVRETDLQNGSPKPGAPLLLVRVFDANGQVSAKLETNVPGPPDKAGKPFPYSRIVAGGSTRDAHFKTLLLPVKAGEALPQTTFNAPANRLSLQWDEQRDEITLQNSIEGRSRFTVRRGGDEIARVK